MKSDQDLQKDVQDAIQWDPLLKSAEINVAAKDGLVTLSVQLHVLRKHGAGPNCGTNKLLITNKLLLPL